MKSCILTIALATLSLIGTLPAQVPRLINYQGRIAVGNTNFNGNGQFKFMLVHTNGFIPAWRNDGVPFNINEPTTAVTIPVANGLYSVLLGDTTLGNMAALPASAPTVPDLSLRVWFNDGVNGFQRLTPDQRLAPAVYLADGAVNSASIASAAITSAKVASGAITSTHIASGAITSSKVASGAITSAHIAPGSITGADIASGSIFGAQIAGGSITGDHIASGTVDATRFATSGVVPIAGQVLGYNGSALTWMPDFAVSGEGEATFGTRPSFDNSRVTISGGAYWTPSFWGGALTLDDGGAIGWRANSANLSSGIGHSNGGLFIFRTPSQISSTAGQITYDLVINDTGNVGIGTTSPVAKLDVAGTTRTRVLTITGGADIAEPFQMKEEELEKGSVVVIDDEHPGRLKRSGSAYDTRVAGIISGANGINAGIALHQEGVLEGGQNVALSGRVYVRADASSGPIKPGDLLTSSDTPGHAMKVSEHTRAQGAVLGKAMSSLNEGTGLVLVLVTLQ